MINVHICNTSQSGNVGYIFCLTMHGICYYILTLSYFKRPYSDQHRNIHLVHVQHTYDSDQHRNLHFVHVQYKYASDQDRNLLFVISQFSINMIQTRLWQTNFDIVITQFNINVLQTRIEIEDCSPCHISVQTWVSSHHFHN